MKKNIDPLLPNTYYHIYNRGINKTNIFFEGSNYYFFLEKYSQYISPVADTYAYCMLKNHFHFLIRIKPEGEIISNAASAAVHADRDPKPVSVDGRRGIKVETYISRQFSHFFNSYSQSINRKYERTGGLFETPFRRIAVEHESYFTQLISYIHRNPQKHELVEDYREYPYSSYHSHISGKVTKLKRMEVLDWFGGRDGYIRFHEMEYSENRVEKLVVELD